MPPLGSTADAPPMGGQNVAVINDRLRAAILSGELAAGDELSQVRLARELGVSRTPLREALRMLISEGLVEGLPNRQLRVSGFSIDDMETASRPQCKQHTSGGDYRCALARPVPRSGSLS